MDWNVSLLPFPSFFHPWGDAKARVSCHGLAICGCLYMCINFPNCLWLVEEAYAFSVLERILSTVLLRFFLHIMALGGNMSGQAFTGLLHSLSISLFWYSFFKFSVEFSGFMARRHGVCGTLGGGS